MPRKLTDAQVAAYRRDGFVGGIPVLDDDEVARFRAELEAFESTSGKPLDFPERSKSYLLFAFADAIVHHPAVLDAVEDESGGLRELHALERVSEFLVEEVDGRAALPRLRELQDDCHDPEGFLVWTIERLERHDEERT